MLQQARLIASLLLGVRPFQGRVLVDLDPMSGESVALPLKANTHQHGVALAPDGRRLLIVGTGLANDARG